MKRFETWNTYIGETIYTCKAKIAETQEDQSNLLKDIVEDNNKSRARTKEDKDKKEILMKSSYALYNAFKSGIFPIKSKKGWRTQNVTVKPVLTTTFSKRPPVLNNLS